jgi:hypothetical protein
MERLRRYMASAVREGVKGAIEDATFGKGSFAADIDRVTIFAVLLRCYESQERRDGSIDATLGVLFAALFVAYTAIFNWIGREDASWDVFAATGFAISVAAVGIPLFFWKTREPTATEIAFRLVDDFKHPERGTSAHLRRELALERRPKVATMETLGASGFLAVLNQYLGDSIRTKRLLARIALAVTFIVALSVGGRNALHLRTGGNVAEILHDSVGSHHGQSQQ